jgi:hypothetical protein
MDIDWKRVSYEIYWAIHYTNAAWLHEDVPGDLPDGTEAKREKHASEICFPW